MTHPVVSEKLQEMTEAAKTIADLEAENEILKRLIAQFGGKL
jgi:hypothetical protein